MIRLVHVISDLSTGGAEMMLAKLVGRMDRSRFTNVVVSITDRGQLGERIESSGVKVHTLGVSRGKPDLRALPRLIRILKSAQPTIVQSWLYHADLLATLAVRCSGSPVLVWNLRCSDMDLKHYTFQTRLVQRVLARCSSAPAAVVVNSKAGRRWHEQMGYRPRRWEFIPNGFDVERFHPDSSVRALFRQELGVSIDALIVALVARVDPMKDHRTFLDAAQEAARARQNIHFVLVGKDTETLASHVADRRLFDRVHLLGQRNEIERILPGVDLVCLSSAFGEGFPTILGEAMACGVPCVTTDVGDARLIVGETGVVVPPRNPSALAEAMIDLVDRGPDVRRRLGQAARERVTTEYSLPRVTDRYQAFYENLVACTPYP